VRVTPFETYKEYLALKRHFSNTDYNYFKYNGKVNANQNSFETRKDKLFFQKLSKHSDVTGFLIANLSKNEKAWIRELAYSDESERLYKDWLKRTQSLTYHVKEQLKYLDKNFDSNFKVAENKHPKIIQLYLGNVISLDTFSVLIDLIDCLDYWDKYISDPIWDLLAIKVRKYTPFLKYDKNKMRKIVLDYFNDL
jgi:hypothetical protein